MNKSVSAFVRELLEQTPDMPTDDVIQKVKSLGVAAEETSVRNAVYNARSAIKKQKEKASAKPAPKVKPAAPPLPPPAAQPDQLGKISIVNAVVVACGGVPAAQKFVEAVKVCGGPDEFNRALALIAEIKGSESK